MVRWDICWGSLSLLHRPLPILSDAACNRKTINSANYTTNQTTDNIINRNTNNIVNHIQSNRQHHATAKRNMMMRLIMSRMNRNEEKDNLLRSTIGLLKHKIHLTKRFDLYLYLCKQQQQRDSWHWLAQYSQYTAHPTHCLASEDGEG